MKVTNSLDKPSRRRFVWLDKDGDLWFWNAYGYEWYVLTMDEFGWSVEETFDIDDEDIDWDDAPFTKVARNPFYVRHDRCR